MPESYGKLLDLASVTPGTFTVGSQVHCCKSIINSCTLVIGSLSLQMHKIDSPLPVNGF